MESDSFLVLLGGLVVLAFIAEELFRRALVPPVLVLMLCGVALGPVAHVLPAEEFTRVASHFGALAFLLILFEGGLDLDIRAVVHHVAPGAGLALSGFGVAFASATSLARFAGMAWEPAVVLGVILAPISGAIVLPLAGRLGFRDEVRTLVILEAALADVLAVLGMGFVSGLRSEGGLAGLLALGSLLAAVFSVTVAVVAGLAWPRAVRTLADRQYVHVLTLGVVLMLWGSVQLLGASGALVALVFGLTLANERQILTGLGLDSARLSRVLNELNLRLHRFIAQLTFLVRAFFFVFLGVVVNFDTLRPPLYATGVAVVGLFLAGRWLLLRLFQRHGRIKLTAGERRNVLFLQPRGLVSAVLAVEAIRLNVPGARAFLGLASLVIVVSNVLMAIGLRRPAGEKGSPDAA